MNDHLTRLITLLGTGVSLITVFIVMYRFTNAFAVKKDEDEARDRIEAKVDDVLNEVRRTNGRVTALESWRIQLETEDRLIRGVLGEIREWIRDH